MKKFSIALSFLAALTACPAGAYDGDGVRFFTSLDHWTPDGAHEKTEEAWTADLDNFDAGSVSSEISAGLGFRAGAFWATSVPGLEVGGSLGYVRGPKGEFRIFTEDFAPGAATWTEKDDYETRFVRILLQAQKRFPMSERFDIRLGAGAGFASGKMENEYSCVATGSGGCTPSDSASESFSGVTYEVGPSVAYLGERVNVELGVVYAAFPTMKESGTPTGGQFLEFKWTPVGIRLGVEF